jgi:hypothetical protein
VIGVFLVSWLPFFIWMPLTRYPSLCLPWSQSFEIYDNANVVVPM